MNCVSPGLIAMRQITALLPAKRQLCPTDS